MYIYCCDIGPNTSRSWFLLLYLSQVVTNFIQLISPQPVDQFSQTAYMQDVQKQQQTTEISGHQ